MEVQTGDTDHCMIPNMPAPSCLAHEIAGAAGGASLCSYKVEVQTGDVRGAGTDSDVSITVFGSKGDTGSRPLETGANDFERGHLDTFFFTVGVCAHACVCARVCGSACACGLDVVCMLRCGMRRGRTPVFPHVMHSPLVAQQLLFAIPCNPMQRPCIL